MTQPSDSPSRCLDCEHIAHPEGPCPVDSFSRGPCGCNLRQPVSDSLRWPPGYVPRCATCDLAPSHPLHTDEGFSIPGMAEMVHEFEVRPEDERAAVQAGGRA